ncbi:hypothetical protein EJB05_14554 [Eragrostis curvula]|uniref:Ubiquitin-like protease family profile domain-containing protein n=1 Tax=Eragrostis curvula TaxID=38414 RepID=A0A5J9VZE8_9POAL|nr:hypothetical protein EJB05_14554 [Eragrostis curvula]
MDSSKRKRSSLGDQENLKKPKVPSYSESIALFIDVVSGLSERQKSVVHGLGFSSLLGLSCSDVPSNLVHWLVQHFDTDTRTLNLPNGFKFIMNTNCVKKILDLPSGGSYICGKGTLESYQYISHKIKSDGLTPSVHELCSLINDDVQENEFALVFVLLALAAFLCPNTRGVCSVRYYPAIVNVKAIKDCDWCTFVLEWLVSYIKKFQATKGTSLSSSVGGCTLLLVISYLEFLSTSELKIGSQLPRISVWTSRYVQTFTYLDCIADSGSSFGRLQLKHVCCTPFNDCFTAASYDSVFIEDIQKLLKSNVAPCLEPVVLNLVTDLYSKLQQSVHPSSLSAVCHSLLNVVNSMCSVISLSAQKRSCIYLEDTDSENECEDIMLRLKVTEPLSNKEKIAEEVLEFFSKYFTPLPVPEMKNDVSDFASDVSSIFDSLQEASFPLHDDLISEFHSFSSSIEDLVFARLEIQSVDVEELTFDLNSFALEDQIPKKKSPDQYADVELIESMLKSFEESSKAVSVPNVEESSKQMSVNATNLQSCSQMMVPAGKTILDSCYPNFDLVSDSCENVQDNHFTYSLLKGMQKDFRNCSNMIDEEAVISGSRRNQAIINATTVEKDFFQLFTSRIDRSTQSIKVFQIGPTYVDQFKLSLSMMNNGWIHYHVMNSFLKMLGCEQDSIVGVEGHVCQQYIDSQTSALLMQSSLDHNKYKKNFLEIVGFRLYRAGLLHIPCFIKNQWFLVVVNFVNQSFDILDSEKNPVETKKLAYAVIHNFKVFFENAFPGNLIYDIKQFTVRSITVPKHNFRFDSGVFVIQFVLTFSGDNIEPFSNVS